METYIKKIQISSSAGRTIQGTLQLPADGKMKAFGLILHCFSCGNNVISLGHVARSLTSHGFGILIIDFFLENGSSDTVLNKNDHLNSHDILEAATFLENHYMAPSLLIGHSLGGSAAILVAEKLPSVKAVATIGASFSKTSLSNPDKTAVKKIAGTAETLFSNESYNNLAPALGKLNRSLLLLHSPQDLTVPVDQARLIYEAAKHPKSFISLDGADHLLSASEDALYAGNVIASWASRYLPDANLNHELSTDQQVVALTGKEGYVTQIKTGEHFLIADEPLNMGGQDLGPSPYGLLLSALGACTGMTLRMYADRKGWPLEEVRIHMSHEKVHLKDSEKGEMMDHIYRYVEISGPLDEVQVKRLLEIANRCPVHRTLERSVKVETRLKE